jgi:hypothetical protein
MERGKRKTEEKNCKGEQANYEEQDDEKVPIIFFRVEEKISCETMFL